MFLYIIICHGITGMIPCPKTVLEIILEITPRPYMRERQVKRETLAKGKRGKDAEKKKDRDR